MANFSRTPSAPKIAPKPGRVKVVRALYSYTAQSSDELTFQEGDVLYVTDQITDKNWWKAKCGSNVGLIPSNYVETSTEEVLYPLHDAARRGNLANVRHCLTEGVSATCLDSAGNTPLFWACHSGHVECVQELLAVSSQAIDAQNRIGDTPLHAAASKGHLEVVQLLLDSGADCTVKNSDGLLPENLTSVPAIKSAIQSKTMKRQSSSSYAPEEYCDDDGDLSD